MCHLQDEPDLVRSDCSGPACRRQPNRSRERKLTFGLHHRSSEVSSLCSACACGDYCGDIPGMVPAGGASFHPTGCSHRAGHHGLCTAMQGEEEEEED